MDRRSTISRAQIELMENSPEHVLWVYYYIAIHNSQARADLYYDKLTAHFENDQIMFEGVQAGYYRHKRQGYKEKGLSPYYPIGFWEVGGELTMFINGKSYKPQDDAEKTNDINVALGQAFSSSEMAGMFHKCRRRPVLYSAYKHAVRTGRWLDDPEPSAVKSAKVDVTKIPSIF